jgi:hypothetical protein
MATGDEKFTCCQPELLSPVKVALASRVPVLLQRFPTWVPVLLTPLKKRTPVMKPLELDVNFTPNSTGRL